MIISANFKNIAKMGSKITIERIKCCSHLKTEYFCSELMSNISQKATKEEWFDVWQYGI